jgi:uncharacterized surface protein with fasciclin (FAS1) repeats
MNRRKQLYSTMKKLIIVFITVLNASFASAQKADTIGKLKNTNGALMSASNNITGNISSAPEFSTLASAIKTANAADTFTGQITVFAPTNTAFEKLPAGKLDTLLLPAHNSDLANLLKYHAVAGKLSAKDIDRQIKAGNGQATFTTLSGGKLTARINANRNIVLTDENGGQSVISKFDIPQSNGLLHVITNVLVPKTNP